MPTLFHSPMSRSTAILALIDEMGISDKIEVVDVSIARRDGSGGGDPRNPHPEKKVPFLVDGEDHVRERGAIITYLTDKYPESGLGRPVGHPQRGAFLSWLFYYQGVMEPVLALSFAQVEHPIFYTTFRDTETMFAQLADALKGQPYLLGEEFSAVDLLVSSPFLWLADALPDNPDIKAWVARCVERPSLKAAAARGT